MLDVYGGEVGSAGEFLHGKTSLLTHDGKGLYKGLRQDIPVTRYHSLAGTYATIPDCLEVTSWITKRDGSKGVIQGARHRTFTMEGVQFHPESILTEEGRGMIRNFLRLQGGTWAENAKLQEKEGPKNSEASTATAASSSKPKSNNILKQIYAHRKAAVEAQKLIPSQRPKDLQAAYDLNCAPPLVPFVERLRQSPFDVALMAEIKRASPSKGVFAMEISAPTQARKYALAGASVISVLTEPEWFKGSLDDLRAVRQVLGGMPNRPAILRKEFVFDEYQILEARLAGADTILLIVKMLEYGLLERLYKYSVSLGMEPLVEVQNSEEMATAVKLGSKAVGVNNRNLENFEVDMETTSRLRAMAPEKVVICALSGINAHEDVLACKKDGVNAVLVGEAIMRAPDAGMFIHQLCAGPHVSPAEKRVPAKLLVKVCGTRSAEAAKTAIEAGADLVGMILVPGAKRCVSQETALEISEAVHSFQPPQQEQAAPSSSSMATDFFGGAFQRLTNSGPKLVGVFQNQPLSEILRLQSLYSLDAVQLHGTEPLEWASSIIPVPVIKVFKPEHVGIGTRGYHTVPHLDSGSGSGKLIDVEKVKSVLKGDEGLVVMLAGGLNEENVQEVVASLGEEAGGRVLGVDVSSGIETDGKQDLGRIRAFVKLAKGIR